MKRNIFPKICIALLLFAFLFACSNDDDKEAFVAGDTTALSAELTACQEMLDTVTTADYTQASINTFKAKVDTIQSVIDEETVSAQEIINLTVHLSNAKTIFLNSKIEGISESALLAGWSFDEGEGTSLTADGTLGLVATLKSGPSEIFSSSTLPEFVDKGVDKAMYFTNGAHLEVSDYKASGLLGKQLSIAVWLKPDGYKSNNYIASLNYWNNWKLQLQETGKPYFTIATASGITDADNETDLSVPSGSWKHLVVVLDLTSSEPLRFYINGVESKVWTSTAKPYLTGSQASEYSSSLGSQLPFMIGCATTYAEASTWSWSGWETASTWYCYSGIMDEIKFYNIALSQGQITYLYSLESENLVQ
jgi:hypothetical protein